MRTIPGIASVAIVWVFAGLVADPASSSGLNDPTNRRTARSLHHTKSFTELSSGQLWCSIITRFRSRRATVFTIFS